WSCVLALHSYLPPTRRGGCSPGETRAGSTQRFPPLLVVRHDAAEPRPELPPVILVHEMDELVGDDVIDELHGRLHDAPVEADVARCVARAPALLLITDEHCLRLDAELGGPVCDP